jgi:iduronate 2-sulfatase
MKNIIVGFTFSLMILTCSTASKKVSDVAAKKDKNVLFIMVDDLNNTLGTYGHPLVKTPNVDKLAAAGVQYNNAYCNFAVGGPSRGSLLTGLRPETINILDNRTPLQPLLECKTTLPRLFKQNGFQTMGLGKIFHGTSEDHGDPEAWDEYYNFKTTEIGRKGESRNMTEGKLKWCRWQSAEGTDEDQEDGQIAKKAVELIKQKRDKPFFLAVGFKKPHDPFIAPKKYFDMYPLEDCNPPQLPEGWKAPYSHSLPGETKTFDKFTDLERREFLRSYYACTSFMDAQVGKVLDALKESGQLDNTLIVFFGDHGYHLGEHNWWNKVTIFEKGTNAPFIIAGNAVSKKGIKSSAMFEFVDIYPTLSDVMGLKNVPDYLEGKSFAASINDGEKAFRSEVRAVSRRGDMLGRMVKNEDWRYIEWDFGKKGHELYNQHDDPIEYNNLAEDDTYAGIISEMKELLYKAN